jgi:hypothetical protein
LRRRKPTGFLPLFWSVAAVLACYTVFTMSDRPWTFTLAGLTIAISALLPGWLWCHGSAKGLPIYPVFSATFVMTSAFQLLSGYQRLSEEPDEATWRASLTIAGFLLTATLVWMFWLNRPRALPTHCRVLRGQRGNAILLTVLGLGAAFTLIDHAGWAARLPGGLFTALRGVLRGPTAFAVFILGMRWGAKALTIPQRTWFIALLGAFCAIDASSLFLVTAIGVCLMMLAGFAVGRKTFPWGRAAFVVGVFGLLHVGKGEMRLRHWGEELAERPTVKPWEIPAVYAEWARVSVEAMTSQREAGEQTQSFLARANTIDLLLQAQRMSPGEAPFLHGETYALIPRALVPRLINPDKGSPHDSTTLLNIHYGNQTYESAQVTSIGWGMLNEAFANFGYLGCLGLAVVLGSFYGTMTRWSVGLPLTSVPALVGVFTVSFAIQTEMTAAIFITSYAQGLFALLVLAWLFAERIGLQDNKATGQQDNKTIGRYERLH